MAFNNNNLDSFFFNGPQMALSANVRARLALEGLVNVDDFSDFKEEELKAAFKNMRTAIPGIPGIQAIPEQVDVNGIVIAPAIQAVPPIPPILPCLVSAKCALRLKVASIAWHYYDSIDRVQTPQNMNYTNVLKDFYVEHEMVFQLASEEKPDIPLLHKNTTPLKWIESFKECVYRTYGVRKTPLSYLVRANDDVPIEAEDPLINGKPYGEAGSVIDELINRLDLSDVLSKQDNSTLYSMLEEATRGTIYATTVTSNSRGKDGRKAWLAMTSSHAGDDKWDSLFTEKSKFIMNVKWNGRNYSLEKFTGLHRSAYVQMQEASTHVTAQLPTAHTRVGYLLDNIMNPDPDLRAAISTIRMDSDVLGKRNDFEEAVKFLLPVDPYIKHRKNNQGRSVHISDTNALMNQSSSSTGVDFRWYTYDEYKTLSKEQKSELYEWQENNVEEVKKQKDAYFKNKSKKTPSASDNKSLKNSRKRFKAKIAKLKAENKKLTEAELSAEDIQACLAPLTSTSPTPTPTPAAPATVSTVDPRIAAATVRLKSILKRKRAP